MGCCAGVQIGSIDGFGAFFAGMDGAFSCARREFRVERQL